VRCSPSRRLRVEGARPARLRRGRLPWGARSSRHRDRGKRSHLSGLDGGPRPRALDALGIPHGGTSARGLAATMCWSDVAEVMLRFRDSATPTCPGLGWTVRRCEPRRYALVRAISPCRYIWTSASRCPNHPRRCHPPPLVPNAPR